MNVVIVDDSHLVRERVAKRVSELPGVCVIGEASNSIEALEIVREKIPDVIILDIKMPGDNGMDVLQQIKNEYPHIKIIMLTNYPLEPYRAKCYENGADHFLDKSDEFEKVTDLLIDIEKKKSDSVLL